ncbi:MAG: methyltransferase domain-containing protein [Candidatus Latescibacterota bacterium]
MPAWEFDGERYRQASAHQKEWGTGLIERLRLCGSESVLDLGCGDGVLTALLADRVPQGRVLGLDASAGMVQAARSLARPNLRFEQLDVTELDVCEAYDVVFSNAALHWIKDHTRLLAACRRALRPGGTLGANFAAAGNCPNMERVLRQCMGYPRFAPHFAGFAWPWYMPEPAQYEALLAAAGFPRYQVQGQVRDRRFPDTASLVRWIDQPGLVPFLPSLPERERAAFRDNVVSEMVELTMQADGTCLEAFRRLEVMARRGEGEP